MQIIGGIYLLHKSVCIKRAKTVRLEHEAFPHTEQLDIMQFLVTQSRIATFDFMQTGIIKSTCQL